MQSMDPKVHGFIPKALLEEEVDTGEEWEIRLEW